MDDGVDLSSITISKSVADRMAVTTPPPPVIAISGDGGAPLVKIHPDGRLEYGPEYQPDEAARIFWEAMRHYMPTRCRNCAQVGLKVGP